MAEPAVSEEYKKLTEKRLEALLKEKDADLNSLYEAMRYSALGGGKRVRALLVFGFFNACAGQSNPIPAVDYAAAVEMMHAASLIHDDLPSMDNDDYRRGKLSSHKVFGEAGAILAGDGLFIKAFETLSSNKYCSSSQNAMAVSILAAKAGPDGMTGGQMIDMTSENDSVNKKTLEKLHLLKTSCLISCACMLGCVAAGADEEKIKAAEEYGRCLGLAFQIRDDILDVEGDSEKMGKTLGKDIKEGKATYPSVFGMEKSQLLCKALTEQAVNSLSAFGSGDEVKILADFALNLSYRNK